MHKRHAALVVALFPALFFIPGPAQAASDTSTDNPLTIYVDCPLERIGTQLVRCDNLTGTGAAAPFWIPEQR